MAMVVIIPYDSSGVAARCRKLGPTSVTDSGFGVMIQGARCTAVHTHDSCLNQPADYSNCVDVQMLETSRRSERLLQGTWLCHHYMD